MAYCEKEAKRDLWIGDTQLRDLGDDKWIRIFYFVYAKG
jgi:hypothetical protein